jgi:hypothetical protein
MRFRHAQPRTKSNDEASPVERERSELQARVVELEAEVRTLEQQLEDAGKEHAREHELRRELEEWLGPQLAALEDAQRDLKRRTADAATQSRRVDELEAELEQAREAVAQERGARQRLEERLDLLVASERDARAAREQRMSELEQAHAEALRRAEAAERALAVTRDKREVPAPPTSDLSDAGAPAADVEAVSTVDLPAVAPTGNGPAPARPGKLRASEPARRRRRLAQLWRRRAQLPCSVCHRSRPAMNDAELTANGWALTSAGALCPDCRQHGWDFPPDASVPFRRVDAPFPR